jgi:hypothetical protein
MRKTRSKGLVATGAYRKRYQGKSIVGLMSYSLKIMDRIKEKYGPEGGQRMSALDEDLHKLVWMQDRLIEIVDNPKTDNAERKAALEFGEAADKWSVHILGLDIRSLDAALKAGITKGLEEAVRRGAATVEDDEDLDLPEFDDEPGPEGAQGRTATASNAVDPWAHLRH